MKRNENFPGIAVCQLSPDRRRYGNGQNGGDVAIAEGESPHTRIRGNVPSIVATALQLSYLAPRRIELKI